jgi:prevent-host-death family protein
MAKKPESYASIGQVKRDISELVNRVAYGGERVILTSRGKPKAALISVEDLEQIKQQDQDRDADWWEKWKADAAALRAEILAQRGGAPIDVDRIIEENRRDLESRDDWLFERE